MAPSCPLQAVLALSTPQNPPGGFFVRGGRLKAALGALGARSVTPLMGSGLAPDRWAPCCLYQCRVRYGVCMCCPFPRTVLISCAKSLHELTRPGKEFPSVNYAEIHQIAYLRPFFFCAWEQLLLDTPPSRGWRWGAVELDGGPLILVGFF